MRVAVWMTVIFTCLIGITVDSAILREYRIKGKITGAMVDSNAAKNATGTDARGHPRSKSRRKTFRPMPSSCCQIGYKVAKRKLSCDIRILEVVRKYNDLQRRKIKYNRPRKIRPSKISARLSAKLGKCAATYPSFLEKCCKTRDQYDKRLEKCKKRPRRERRRCRLLVRRRLGIRPSKSKGRKKQTKPKAGRGRRKG